MMAAKGLLRLGEAASISLFFLQALRVAFSVLFGVIYDQIFEGPMSAWLFISVGLLLAALLSPLAAPGSPRRSWLAVTASLAAAARVGMTVNDATVRYWSALVVLAAGALYLASLLTARRPTALPALVIALAGDQALRAAGFTYDISLRDWWLPVQAVWALLIIFVAVSLARRSAAGDRSAGGLTFRAGLALGGLLYLETSLLSLPNAVARWTHFEYAVVAPLLALATLAVMLPRLRYWFNHAVYDSLAFRWALLGLLTLALMAGYFLAGPLPALGLIVAQTCAIACAACLLDGRGPGSRNPGPALALGLGLFVILNFLNAFAFTYAYVLPPMREMGWAVYLVAAAALALGVLRQAPGSVPRTELAQRTGQVLAFGMVIIIIVIGFSWPVSPEPLPDDGRLTVATYNIHYGYDDVWHLTLEDQVEAIQEAGVDVIAMQEVDAGRMTSYGVDNAYFLARSLGMNAAYQPAVEHLTGIALLYRGTAAPSRSMLLTSQQEQTGIVGVELGSEGQSLHAFGIWMGLDDEDTLTQIEEALEFIGDASPAVFGGDFNAQPDEDVPQAVLAAGFDDPFAEFGDDPATYSDPAIEPYKRIDFVWVRELEVTEAWVSPSLASDHRMVVVEVVWP
jgi:endonuclease/exonuclease/phosphatase family metal-dependent hydrolase